MNGAILRGLLAGCVILTAIYLRPAGEVLAAGMAPHGADVVPAATEELVSPVVLVPEMALAPPLEQVEQLDGMNVIVIAGSPTPSAELPLPNAPLAATLQAHEAAAGL